MHDDEDCKGHIPIDNTDDSLFHAFDDGIVLCKLLMKIDKQCLLRDAIYMGASLNTYQIHGNLQMGISAAKGLGIRMIGIDAKDFLDKTPHLILGVIW